VPATHGFRLLRFRFAKPRHQNSSQQGKLLQPLGALLLPCFGGLECCPLFLTQLLAAAMPTTVTRKSFAMDDRLYVMR
jgi:hypothetical protein